MARGKSTSEGGKKRGRPASKKESSSKDVKEEVDLEDASDNDETQEDVDTGELPAVPASVQAVKKVIIAPKDIRSATGWRNAKEVYLKHPRTNNKSLFLLCTNNAKGSSTGFQMFEVLTLQQETRSWFVNNTVISDGNLYVFTPVDPLFFAVQALSKSTKTKPIADHFSESALPPVVADTFSKHLSHKQLENVAIKKGCDDIIAFMYSEEKTLAWLSAKAEKVVEFLSRKGISHTEASVSSNFVKSSTESTSKEDCLRYACDILGEYIDDSLKKKLLEKLGLPLVVEKAGVKRKNGEGEEETENEGSNKKSKMVDGDNVPLEDYGSNANGTPSNKATKVTAREKEFQKAAQGSHSLLKFFSAKSK